VIGRQIVVERLQHTSIACHWLNVWHFVGPGSAKHRLPLAQRLGLCGTGFRQASPATGPASGTLWDRVPPSMACHWPSVWHFVGPGSAKHRLPLAQRLGLCGTGLRQASPAIGSASETLWDRVPPSIGCHWPSVWDFVGPGSAKHRLPLAQRLALCGTGFRHYQSTDIR